ncbi:hypothetical protein V6N13_108674 [Hibiscus sabdariffa]
MGNIGVDGPRVYKKDGASFKVVDGRTFKAVLMGNFKQVLEVGSAGSKGEAKVNSLSKENAKSVRSLMVEPLQIVVEEGDKAWLNNCLVGQISAMHDTEFIQQMLRSKGFKVKVFHWFGFYSIIWFDKEMQIEIFWDMRNTTIEPWLDEVDTVNNFLSSHKLRVWLSIKGLPLRAWSKLVFHCIARRWGKVIRLDPEMAVKTILDKAKILLGILPINYPSILTH